MFNLFKKNHIKEYEKILKSIKKEKYNSSKFKLASIDEERIIKSIKMIKDDFKDKEFNGFNIKEDSLLMALIVELININYSINVYDEQILGALGIIDRKAVEMKTGEGKTIVAIIAAIFLHTKNIKPTIYTANDYLVTRDYYEAKKIMDKLGISLGRIEENMPSKQKKINYDSDIVYTTIKTTVNDYANDLMETSRERQIVKNFDFAIVDEADFVLIDESNIPISISVSVNEKNNELRYLINNIDHFEKDKDFTIDEKTNDIKLLSGAFNKLEKLFIEHKKQDNINVTKDDLYTNDSKDYINSLYIAITAHFIYKRDVDYVVKDGEVVIIGKPSGRLMYGRRWRDGLHLAMEIKEGVEPKLESKTVSETNIYHFVSKYKYLSGMSGTIMTESIEFESIYGLEAVEIPTVKKLQRIDQPDIYSLSINQSLEKMYQYIKENRFIENKKPILIGTTTVLHSQIVFSFLQEKGLENLYLINALNAEEESKLMSEAGLAGRVTIATSMSGRGTDIKLGLKDAEKHKAINEVVDGFGGLQIIGFQRNKSRRVDNQLIGRAGRQGDNGSSIFFVSAEDDMVAGFDDVYRKIYYLNEKRLDKYILEIQDEYANAKLNNRKSIIRFAAPLNNQNDIFYSTRWKIIDSKDNNKLIKSAMLEFAKEIAENNKKDILSGKIEELEDLTSNKFINEEANKLFIEYKEKVKDFNFLDVEKKMAVKYLDDMWAEHLQALKNSRINALNATYRQTDPVMVYENEAVSMMTAFWNRFFYNYGKLLINLNPNDFVMETEDDSSYHDVLEFKVTKLKFYVNKIGS